MVSTDPGAVELEPLRGANWEDADDRSDDDRLADLEDGIRNPRLNSSHGGRARAVLWVFCSATAIYTTQQLMISHGFHYPLAIAFRSFAALAVVYIIALRMGSDSRYGLQRSGGRDFLLNRHWAGMVPAALTGAASVPMLFEGILHMPSLPVLVMAFPVIYATESLVLSICYSPPRPQKPLPWEIIVVVAASSAMLYNENRLMVPGLLWGLLGILFIGLSRACFTIGSDRAGLYSSGQAKLKAYHGFVTMTLIFGLVFSGVAGHFFEHIASIYPTPYSTIAMMLLNMLSIIGTCFSGTTLLAYSPLSFDNNQQKFYSGIPSQTIEVVPTLISSIVVLLVAIFSNPVPIVSWIQVALYLDSSAPLLGIDENLVTGFKGGAKSPIPKPAPTKKRKARKLLTFVTLTILAAILSWMISYLSALSIGSIGQSLPSSLDLSYKASSRFDIVVSMYNEDPKLIKEMLDAIKSTAMLNTTKTNVIVYSKDPDANTQELKKVTGANTVETLENLGREGATYLQHIVDKWDKLAEQTMFIQAHAHNMRELIPRINDYLVTETGMLSLGFTGVVCDCQTCGDRWGWEDKYEMVPQLFEKIYKEPCNPKTPILLSYKGQFVASGRRIRGTSKKVYEGLLKSITSKDGPSHNKTIVGDNVDTPDNPYFGFTVERIWGLLMQCGTDGDVAARCPSLLSGKGWGGRASDCQCLDR